MPEPKSPPFIGWGYSVRELLAQSLRVDFSSRDRLITPVFFAAIILLLFSFAIPEAEPSMRSRVMVAESQLAIFFALQIALSRAFEAERVDRVYDHLRLSPIASSAFITAKLLHVIFIGGFTVLCTALMAVLLQGQDPSIVADPIILGAGVLTLLGLTGLGVLVAAITVRAEGHQILFPLIYFPLSVPVLISSTEALTQWIETHQWNDTLRGWSVVLIAFDAIYLTMAVLLGAEAES
jgi:heme exporter protein B